MYRLALCSALLLSASAAAQDIVVTSTNSSSASPYVVTGAQTFNSLTVQSGGVLRIDGATTVTQPLTLAAGSTVLLNSALALDNLNIPSPLNGAVVVSAPLTWDAASLTVNGRLTLDAALTVNGDFTLAVGAILDHSAGDPDFHLQVSGLADLRGLVDANGRGFASNQNITPTMPGAGPGGGGSHGGMGGHGAANAPYGDPLNPTQLGAAGGQENGSLLGGRGGGKISINAGTLRLGGGVTVNGANSPSTWGGGGAGGSILLRATTLEGTGGLQARGGSGNGNGGGGGGRIAVYAATNTWTGGPSTLGGGGGYPGALGTAVIANTASPPAIAIGGGHYRLDAAAVHPSVTMLPGGHLYIDGAATVTQPIAVSAGSFVYLNDGSALSALDIAGSVAGTLMLNAPLTWDQTALTVSGRLTVNAAFTVNGNLTLTSAGVIDHSAGDADFQLTVSGTADLVGVVDVTARGLASNQDVQVNFPGAGPGGGGSHGGRGGHPAANQTYGDALNPVMLGAAGGIESGSLVGGRGGGKVSITAGTLKLGAGITANGGPSPYTWSGGGAGGSILLRATTLEGAGGLQARGGNSNGNGAGGGGRIAVHATTNSWTGTASTAGGTGGYNGELGTVVIDNGATPPELTITDGQLHLTASSSYASITLKGGAELYIDGAGTVTQPISVSAGATVFLNDSAALTNLDLNPTIAGTLVVNKPITWDATSMTVNGRLTVNDALTVNGNLTLTSAGVIDHSAGDADFQLTVTGTADLVGLVDVTARGFASNQNIQLNFPGAGPGGGGSHGGRGGHPAANQTYGDPLNPVMLGAAGGIESGSLVGGRGGGKVSITAGTLRVGAGITANGGPSPYTWSGGGAGGSILLRATTLEGAGGLQARGGSSNGNGAGGGGRIAVHATTNSWTGIASATGGTGGYNGELGTVVIANAATPPALTIGDGRFHLTASASYPSITLKSGAALYIDGAGTVTQPISVPAGATVFLNDSAALTNLDLSPTIAGTLVVNKPITWDATSMTVSGRLALNDALTINGDFTLPTGGVLDHDFGDADFFLDVSGSVDLQALVDVTGRGFASNQAISPTISPAGVDSGGSHGGRGGGVNTNAVYGDAQTPSTLGAAGVNEGGYPGGRGGGKINIRAGALRIGPGIFANGGGSSSWYSGGGAGGSIYLRATTLEGSGPLQAKGGNSIQRGAGGGGRVAVYAGTNSWTGSVTTLGGTVATAGTMGSSLVSSTATPAAIRVGGGYFRTPASGASYASITVLPGAELHVDGPLTVTQPLAVQSGATVYLNHAQALSGVTSLTVAGTVEVNASVVSTTNLTVSGTMIVNAPLSLGDATVSGVLRTSQTLTLANLNVLAGGLVTHPAGAGLTIDATQTVTVALGGRIDVNGAGLPTNTTLDPLTLQPVAGLGNGQGASHGGLGGTRYGVPGKATYGSQLQPTTLGSGAGSTPWNGGAAGGGRVKLTASALNLAGQISATGATPGGSGGSIWIVVDSLTGSGVIRAEGGPGVDGINGGVSAGGGGRIAVEHVTGTFTGTLTALGGAGTSVGPQASMGSTWLRKGAQGALLVQNGEYTMSPGLTFSSLTLAGSSILRLAGNSLVTQPLTIPAGSTVYVETTDALNGLALASTVSGDLVVNAQSALPGARTFTGRLFVNAPLSTGDLTLAGTSVTTLDGQLSSTNDLTLESSAVVRPAARSRKFDLRAARKLTVQVGALIDGRGAGLAGGSQGGYGCNGTAIDPVTRQEIAGSPRYVGGSYGALGGGTSANALYGSSTDVEWPGSGGGCGTANTDLGGNGGGLLRVRAQILELKGTIDASGAFGAGGGGSGGGIHLITTTFTGDGAVRANGGGASSGSGGGGRIYIETATDGFTGLRQANAGSSSTNQPGTAATPNTAITTTQPSIVSTARTVTATNVPYSYDADGKPEVIGNSGAVTWSLPTAPPGATVDATTGAITWTPASVAVATFTLRATASNGSADQTFSVQVYAAPKVTSTAATTAVINTPYSYGGNDSLVVTGSAPLTYTATIAPLGNPGLTVDQTGKIVWTPNALGSHSICVRVSNAVGYDDHCFFVTVNGGGTPPDFTSTPPAAGNVGVAYSYTPALTGSAPMTFTFFQGTAPANATLDASTGAISYTPTAVGNDAFCLQAQNGVGSDVQCWQVSVGAAPIAPQIVSSCSPTATVSRPYHYDTDDKVSATGTGPITFSLVSGPSGMTVQADGTVSWAPDLPGGVTFSILAQNAVGSVTQTCAVGVQTADGSGPAVIIRDANVRAAVGIPYRYSFDGKIHASGDRPISYLKVSGPQSFNVDSLTGAVSWTPAGSGNVDVTVRATNAAGSDTYVFTISVVDTPPSPPVASFTMSPGTGDAPLVVQLDCSSSTAAGGILSQSFAFGDGSPEKQGPAVSHTYQACAGYLVRLKVTDLYGQTTVADKPVAVTCAGQTPPSAKILAVVIEKPGETQVAFSCDCKKGSGDIVAYQWSATDGMFSDQPSGTHLFGPGMHALRVAIIDSNGLTAVDSIPIYASAVDGKKPPTVVATAEPSVAKAPATVKLSADAVDPDGQVVQVKWKFSDGAETTERAPVRSYANPIAEKAVVEVTDNDGLVATAVVDVTITGADNSVPPSFLSRPVEDVFAGQAYSYDKDGLPTVKGKGPFTWELTRAPEGATVDAANGKIAWTAPFGNTGPHDFSLKVTSSAGSATQDWKVAVVDLGGGPATPEVPEQTGCGCNQIAGALPWLWLVLAGAALRRRRR